MRCGKNTTTRRIAENENSELRARLDKTEAQIDSWITAEMMIADMSVKEDEIWKKYIMDFCWYWSLLFCMDAADPDKALSVLKAQGYSDIEIIGYNFLECSEDDIYRTGFTATAPNGSKVQGTVCGGIPKGSTVRYE